MEELRDYDLTEESGFDLGRYFRMFKRRVKIILIVFPLVFLVVAAYQIKKAKKDYYLLYKASFTVTLEPQLEKARQKELYVVKREYGLKDFLDFLESDYVLFSVAEAVSGKEMDYETLYYKAGELRKLLSYLPDRKALTPEDNTVVVNVADANPEKAFKTAEALIKAAKSEEVNLRESTLEQSLTVLEGQKTEVNAELDSVRQELSGFLANNKVLSDAVQDGKIIVDPDAIPSQIWELKGKMASLKGLIDQVQKRKKDEPVLSVYKFMVNSGAGKIDASYLKEYIDKKNSLETLLMTNTEEHPDVVRTKNDLAAIERKMANEINSGLERMSEEYKASLEKKAKLEMLLKEGLAEAINKYKDLKDLLVTKQKTYEDLVAEINDLKYSYKLSAARTFNVTEYPVKPDKPFNEYAREKAKKRGIFSALIIAVLASFGLAFALELMDTSIKEVDEIEALGWVVLAVIPRKKRLALELGRKHIEVREPHSFLKEVFSSLRVNLQFIAADKGLKAIAITSANPDEGKTFVAVNLATVCALAGEKTLLVEGDLRNPGLCDYFHEANLKDAPCTFAGLIEGGEPKPCPTPIENLWVMPAGSLSGKLDVILGRERIHACVTNWKREFDWIFFDIPALQTEGHDVIILKNSDAIVPVVLANKTPRKSLMHLISTLQNLKTNVLGFVLDGVTAIGDHRYFYSYVKRK